MTRSRRTGMILMMVTMLWAVAAIPARAHWADQAVAEVVVDGASTQLTLTFPTGLAAFSDDNRDGQIGPHEVQAHLTELEAFLSERISLTDGRARGQLTVEPTAATALPGGGTTTPSTHSTLRLLYRWAQPLTTLSIRYDLFLPGVPTASCLTTITQGGQVRTFVFTPENRELSLVFGRASTWRQVTSFVALGVRHILTGYDHILFLLSLLMLGGSLRQVVKVATAFTVAHSITLSLAVLNLITLSARLVESAIALSIVYVAAENVWRKGITLRQRWLVTFGFGFVHGLGFASILRDMHLSRANTAVSLIGFNVGVEVGQVAIVTGAFLVLAALQRWSWEPAFRRWVSAGAAVAGLVWFVQRAFLAS